MYCGNCGEKLTHGAKFCSGCGAKVATQNMADEIKTSFIEESDRTFVYQFIYPAIIIYSILPSFSEDKFDKFNYLGGMFGGFIEIAILHFIIFYLWGRKKSTALLNVVIALNVLALIMQIGGTIFDLDPFTRLGFSAIDLEFDESDSLRLVSIFDYLGLSLLVIEIGCLLHLRKRFMQRKQ